MTNELSDDELAARADLLPFVATPPGAGAEVRLNLPSVYYLAEEPPAARIMLRLPRQTHDCLVDQAHRARTSLNQFVLSKAIAPVPDCLILRALGARNDCPADPRRQQDEENS